MCTVTLSYDKNNAQAQQQLAALLATGLFVSAVKPERKDRVYVDNGEVKCDIREDVTDLEDFRTFLHEMVDLEYSLP